MSVPGLRREDFPLLDRITYLNTASVGLVPASVVTPAHGFELELARAGTTLMDEEGEMGILEDTRRGAAALLHRIAEDTGCQVRLVGVLDGPDSRTCPQSSSCARTTRSSSPPSCGGEEYSAWAPSRDEVPGCHCAVFGHPPGNSATFA